MVVKRNFLGKIKRRIVPVFVASALGLGIYGCNGGDSTAPKPQPQKPIATFTVQPNQGYTPFMTNFDGSSSKCPNQVSKFVWDFGDGSIDSTSGSHSNHMYSTPGNYDSGLIVVCVDGQRSDKALEQIVAKDATPSINISNFNTAEDSVSTLDLNGKITSPVYSQDKLTVTATSPQLTVNLNGLSGSVTNKTKDWNGSTYFDLTAEDPDGRKTTKRINVSVDARTDITGYLENVLTGARISGVSLNYKGITQNTDANGNFSFQVPISNDTLNINSGQYYNVKIPINANGQDANLKNLQMIQRSVDSVNGEDLLDFMKTYMESSRWDDADLPVKVFVDNNPPSPEYREAVRQGIMSWDPVVNQWLPQGRKLNFFQFVNSDPSVGVRVDYDTSNNLPEFTFETTFKKGVIKMNPVQVGDARIKTSAHESGHGLGFEHSPYSNHVMCAACPSLVSPFEGLVVATKYKLKKDAVGFYSK